MRHKASPIHCIEAPIVPGKVEIQEKRQVKRQLCALPGPQLAPGRLGSIHVHEMGSFYTWQMPFRAERPTTCSCRLLILRHKFAAMDDGQEVVNVRLAQPFGKHIYLANAFSSSDTQNSFLSVADPAPHDFQLKITVTQPLEKYIYLANAFFSSNTQNLFLSMMDLELQGLQP